MGARRQTLVLVVLVGCGGGGGGGIDADPTTIDASPTSIQFRSPVASATVLGSAVVDLDAGASIDAAEVYVTGEPTPRCTLAARPFQCLVDATSLPAGPFSLSARGLSVIRAFDADRHRRRRCGTTVRVHDRRGI